MAKGRFLTVLSLILLTAGSLGAQVLFGTLTGNVVDQQSAVVAGAAVTVSNKATGFSRETNTDSAGRYILESLPPGTYELKVAAKGFATYTQTEISVIINNVTRIDVSLKVGSVNESVTVEALAQQLQTDKSDLHTDIESKELSQIPITGYRNFQTDRKSVV